MGKRAIVVLSIIWLVLLVAGLSSALTLTLAGYSPGARSAGVAGEERITVTAAEYDIIRRYERTQAVMDIVQKDYYIEVDSDALVLGTIRGLLAELNDPYSLYYTPEEMLQQNDHGAGLYEGVGIQLIADKDGAMIITRTFKGGPAQLSGVRPGDAIIAVDGVPVDARTAQNMDDAIARIKGAPNSTVKLRIDRAGEMLDFELMRRAVTINRVEHQLLEGGIGYMMIYEFMGDDVSGFKEALAALKDADALVIDLRSNPGGLLSDVVAIADMLLPEGLIVYIENRSGEREHYYSDAQALGKPLAILVNGMSASASEILAGAVQDYGAGVIVGEVTFGKGIVQTLTPFRSDGAGVQLTTARYYTPKGRSIHNAGITPDVLVSIDPAFDPSIAGPAPDRDAQLRAAIDLLKEQLQQ